MSNRVTYVCTYKSTNVHTNQTQPFWGSLRSDKNLEHSISLNQAGSRNIDQKYQKIKHKKIVYSNVIL